MGTYDTFLLCKEILILAPIKSTLLHHIRNSHSTSIIFETLMNPDTDFNGRIDEEQKAMIDQVTIGGYSYV